MSMIEIAAQGCGNGLPKGQEGDKDQDSTFVRHRRVVLVCALNLMDQVDARDGRAPDELQLRAVGRGSEDEGARLKPKLFHHRPKGCFRNRAREQDHLTGEDAYFLDVS